MTEQKEPVKEMKKAHARSERKQEPARARLPGLAPPGRSCEDSHCPWHAPFSARTRLLKGIVRSARMTKTAVVSWPRLRWYPKYERYARLRTRVKAHNPPCIAAREGETVLVAECRPISKTKHFVIVGRA